MPPGDEKQKKTVGYTPTPAPQTEGPNKSYAEQSSEALLNLKGDPVAERILADIQQPAGGGGPRRKAVTQQVTIGQPQTEEQQQGLEQADYMSEQAMQARREAGVDIEMERTGAAMDIEEIQARYQREAAKRAKQAQAEQQRGLQAANTVFTTVQKQKDAVDQQSKNLGEDAYWRKRGAGAKVLAAISNALGAVGASLTGTPNFAMEIIQTSIRNELDAQRDRLSVSRAELQDTRNTYAQMLQQLGNSSAAYHAAESVYLKNVRDKIRERRELMKDNIAIERANQAEALVDKQLADANRKAIEAYLPTTTLTTTRASGGARKKVSFLDYIKQVAEGKQAMQQAGLLPKESEDGSITIPGVGAVKSDDIVTTRDRAKALSNMIDAHGKAAFAADAVREFEKDENYGKELLSTLPVPGRQISEAQQKAEYIQENAAYSLARTREPNGPIRREETDSARKSLRRPGAVGEVQVGYDQVVISSKAGLIRAARIAGVDPKKALIAAEKVRNEQAELLKKKSSDTLPEGSWEVGEE